MDTHRTILLTGATGYVGGALLPRLLDAGHDVRALVRDRAKASSLDGRATVFEGDVTRTHPPRGLDEALAGVDVAYYLVHSMGRGNPEDFAERDRTGARTFGDAAARAGVGRVVYLGGLEDDSDSEHLRSRHEVADLLRERIPELVYARAAMVIGRESVSFVMVRSLVERLPVMVTPRWVDTVTQPVAVRDVCAALTALATFENPPGAVQLGGADRLTYRQMMRRYAAVAGRRPPSIVPVPVLSPSLSSLWVSLFTPVERGLVRPLVEGLGTEMLVTDPPPPGINDHPLGFDDAVREALAGA